MMNTKQHCRVFLALATISLAASQSRSAVAADSIVAADPAVLYLDTAPVRASTAPALATASQRGDPQLNQLLQFEATPDICAEGEGYLSAQYEHLNYDVLHQNRFALQGQYGVTDQVAVGASLPFLYNTGENSNRTTDGIGDVVLFGQYKCDKLIDPTLFSLTAHVSVVLPTGDHTQLRERGQFGVRPLVLAYKDFGNVGTGRLGAYGLLGFTLSGDADVRWGVAGTYQLGDVLGILELSGEDGSNYYGNIGTFTPGVTYRGFEHFELTVGIPLGLTNDAASWGATAKLTYAFQN